MRGGIRWKQEERGRRGGMRWKVGNGEGEKGERSEADRGVTRWKVGSGKGERGRRHLAIMLNVHVSTHPVNHAIKSLLRL